MKDLSFKSILKLSFNNSLSDRLLLFHVLFCFHKSGLKNHEPIVFLIQT